MVWHLIPWMSDYLWRMAFQSFEFPSQGKLNTIRRLEYWGRKGKKIKDTLNFSREGTILAWFLRKWHWTTQKKKQSQYLADLWLNVSSRDSTSIKLPPGYVVEWWKALREHLKCQFSGLQTPFLLLPKQSSEINTSDRDGDSWGSWLWESGLPGEPSWKLICMVRLLRSPATEMAQSSHLVEVCWK